MGQLFRSCGGDGALLESKSTHQNLIEIAHVVRYHVQSAVLHVHVHVDGHVNVNVNVNVHVRIHVQVHASTCVENNV